MRAVVKIGTSSITNAMGELDEVALAKLCEEIVVARTAGHTVTVVCSGAIAAGSAVARAVGGVVAGAVAVARAVAVAVAARATGPGRERAALPGAIVGARSAGAATLREIAEALQARAVKTSDSLSEIES